MTDAELKNYYIQKLSCLKDSRSCSYTLWRRKLLKTAMFAEALGVDATSVLGMPAKEYVDSVEYVREELEILEAEAEDC